MDEIQLTPEEEKQLEGFSDPDEAGDQVGFKWDEEFQRELLSLFLKDRYLLIQSLDLVDPNYFTNEVHKATAALLFDYFKKYRALPKKSFLAVQLEEAIAKKKLEIKQHYRQEFNLVYDYYSDSTDSRDFVLDKITKFAQRMAIKSAFGTCSRMIQEKPEDEDTLDSVRDILKKAILVDRDTGLGLDYFASVEERYREMQSKLDRKDSFTTGFQIIDSALMGGGLDRGEMGAWMGLSGSGKSLSLVKAAIANMNKGHKVLYISLELDTIRVAERFDAQLADPARVHDVGIGNLIENQAIVFQGLNDYLEDHKSIFNDDRQRLIIKQFPGSSMGVSEFRAYYAQAVLHGFQPDLVIIDYVGEMKDYPKMPTWESRYRIVRDLRGFAVEEQICMLTALQPNKSAKEVIREGRLIDDENLADAYGQIKPLDAFWTLNQTKDEQKIEPNPVVRGLIVKHRHGKSGKQFYMEMDSKTLEIREIGEQEYKRRKLTFEQVRQIDGVERTAEQLEHQSKMNHFKSQQAKKGMEKLEREEAQKRDGAMAQLASEEPVSQSEIENIVKPVPSKEEVTEKKNSEYFGEE
jgi:hypothetical protein